MEEISSDRGSLFILNNNVYKKKKVINGVKYFKCERANCPSSVKVDIHGEVSGRVHNHPPNEVRVEMLRFRADLKVAAIEDIERGPRDIFNDVSRR